MSDYPNPNQDLYPPPLQPQPAPVVQEQLVNPIVTYAILTVTTLVYLAQWASQFLNGGNDLIAAWGWKDNAAIVAGEYWRLFTPMLLHANILHIGFNMYALIVIGVGIERRFGHWRYLLLYVLSGFAGNVFSFLFSPEPSLGASTAIFGLLGAEMVFLYQHRKLYGGQARRALQNVISVAGVNFLIGLSPGIDNWGHLGGLMGGLIFTWFGGPLLVLQGSYPLFQVEDEHGGGQTLLATIVVGVIFGILAMGRIGGLY